MNIRRLVCRLANNADIEAVLAFYRRIESPFIRIRGYEIYERAVINKALYVMDEQGDILGAGGIFVHEDASRVEFGGMGFDDAIRGFNLVPLVMSIAVCHCYIYEYENFPQNAVLAVKRNAEHVVDKYVRMGFHEIENLGDILGFCHNCQDRKKIEGVHQCCLRYYGINKRTARKCIDAYLKDSFIRTDASGNELQIECKIFDDDQKLKIIRESLL